MSCWCLAPGAPQTRSNPLRIFRTCDAAPSPGRQRVTARYASGVVRIFHRRSAGQNQTNPCTNKSCFSPPRVLLLQPEAPAERPEPEPAALSHLVRRLAPTESPPGSRRGHPPTLFAHAGLRPRPAPFLAKLSGGQMNSRPTFPTATGRGVIIVKRRGVSRHSHELAGRHGITGGRLHRGPDNMDGRHLPSPPPAIRRPLHLDILHRHARHGTAALPRPYHGGVNEG